MLNLESDYEFRRFFPEPFERYILTVGSYGESGPWKNQVSYESFIVGILKLIPIYASEYCQRLGFNHLLHNKCLHSRELCAESWEVEEIIYDI